MENSQNVQQFGCQQLPAVCSVTYELIIEAKNSLSQTDPGIQSKFTLTIYSGRILDQGYFYFIKHIILYSN